MKKEQISDALNMLNDDIIEETNKVRADAKPKRKWVKWGAVAACLCLAVIIAIPVLHHMTKPGKESSLPGRCRGCLRSYSVIWTGHAGACAAMRPAA